jgi:hypothetical protein
MAELWLSTRLTDSSENQLADVAVVEAESLASYSPGAGV